MRHHDPGTAEDGEQPAAPLAERAIGATADELERLVERGERLALLATLRKIAPRQTRKPPSVTMNDGTPP